VAANTGMLGAMTGYRLELAGLACAGAMACGPSVEDAATEGDGTAGTASGEASQGGATESSQGYPLTDGDSSGPEPECMLRGDICGEFLVCECSCDISDLGCCWCEEAACTRDAHCEPGSVCIDVDDTSTWVELACVTAECADPVDALVATDEDAASYAGVACLASLTAMGPGVADLAAFESLVSIDGALRIEGTALADLGGLEGLTEINGLAIVGNPGLTDIGALFDLSNVGQSPVFFNTIRDNPSLPAADVHAWLESIDASSTEVCGNLDDEPCP
jgi:hypothetical protein